MEGYQQLFALIKNPKYVKMRPPEKRAAIRIEQYCKRRKDRKKPKRQEDSSCVFAYYFCRGTCHRRDTAGKEKRAEINSAQIRKKELCKSRQDDTAGKSSRERQAPVLYAAVRVRHRSYGVSRILDPSPGGSQDTGGAFRSRVQRPGVRHRSVGAGHIAPCGSVLTWHK